MIDRIKEVFWPVAKAWIGVAVTAASPIIISWVQDAGSSLVVWAVGTVTAFLGGAAVWAVPNKP